MFRPVVILLFLVASVSLSAQQTHDMMVGLQGDLVKTDQSELLGKAQFGAEFNYFASPRITFSSGFEMWTADEFSFVLGARVYPTDFTFIRLRGLVGENDISIGAAWIKPIHDNIRFEAIGDFYFKIDFAIRAGLVYIIRKN